MDEACDDLFEVGQTEDLTETDHRLVSTAAESLRYGISIRNWWQQTDRSFSYARRFPLARTFNHPVTAFGFFDTLSLDGTNLPVMGAVDEEIYDRPRTSDLRQWQSELRE